MYLFPCGQNGELSKEGMEVVRTFLHISCSSVSSQAREFCGFFSLASKYLKIKDKRSKKTLILKLMLATFTVLDCLEISVQCTAFKSFICFMYVLLTVEECSRQKKCCSTITLFQKFTLGNWIDLCGSKLAGKHVSFDSDII